MAEWHCRRMADRKCHAISHGPADDGCRQPRIQRELLVELARHHDDAGQVWWRQLRSEWQSESLRKYERHGCIRGRVAGPQRNESAGASCPVFQYGYHASEIVQTSEGRAAHLFPG